MKATCAGMDLALGRGGDQAVIKDGKIFPTMVAIVRLWNVPHESKHELKRMR